jgi:hypothetical protein
VRIERRSAQLTSITARLDGIDVEGEVAVSFDGELIGEIRANLLQGYLRRSLLLAVPAVLADRVTIPIVLGGSVRAPEVNADLARALGGLLSKNRVGDAVTGVMDEIWSTLGGGSRPSPASNNEAAIDAVFDRILAGDPESDRLIDSLVEAGIDADEIRRRLDERRKRRPGA